MLTASSIEYLRIVMSCDVNEHIKPVLVANCDLLNVSNDSFIRMNYFVHNSFLNFYSYLFLLVVALIDCNSSFDRM